MQEINLEKVHVLKINLANNHDVRMFIGKVVFIYKHQQMHFTKFQIFCSLSPIHENFILENIMHF